MPTSSIEIRNILKSMNYPLTKKDIVQQAKKHGASYEIIEFLRIFQTRDTPAITMSSMNAKANSGRGDKLLSGHKNLFIFPTNTIGG